MGRQSASGGKELTCTSWSSLPSFTWLAQSSWTFCLLGQEEAKIVHQALQWSALSEASKTRLAKIAHPEHVVSIRPLHPTNERTSRRDGVAGFPYRLFLNQIRRNRPTPRDPQQ